MNENVQWKLRKKIEGIAPTLAKLGYGLTIADTTAEAAEAALALIPEQSTVGLGGSVTLDELGIVERIRNGPWKLIDRYRTKSWDERMQRYREALDADVFVTGVNAITNQGWLVDMDSSGNRVAATIFGPRKVIVVAGANKIVEGLDEAFSRIREIAPMNCRRLGHKTPCAETGSCADCEIAESMCNYVGIVRTGLKENGRFHLVLVAESLGF